MPDRPRPPDALLLAFAERVLGDRLDGAERTLEDYLADYPGHESWIAREYARLRGAAVDGTAHSADDEPTPRTLGGYELVREVARGGQAVVHEAFDPRLKRRVAVKVLRVDPDFGAVALARFTREAELTARLDDPAICPVLGTGVGDGVAWIAMRFVDGRTLADELANRRAAHRAEADDALLGWFETMLRALHRAHALGIVHRDLKPGNLMVDADGRPVIVDFGLARADDAGGVPTRTGDRLGTPAYMAPEQIRGEPSDARTDVHAMGVALFELVTLRHPFVGERATTTTPSREVVYRSILESDAPDARRAAPAGRRAVSRELAAVLARAMAKDPRRRYPTAADFADDLARLRRGEPVSARPVGPVRRTFAWSRRRPLAAVALALAALSIVGALVGSLAFLAALRGERDATRRALRTTRALALSTAAREETRDSPIRGLVLALASLDAEPSEGALTALHGAWADAREQASWQPELAQVLDLRVLPDGHRVAFLSRSGAVWLADADAPDAAPLELARLPTPVAELAPHPDGERFAVVADGGLWLVSTATPGRSANLVPAGSSLRAVCIAPTGDRLATGDAHGELALRDSTGAVVEQPALPRDMPAPVERVGWSPDGRHVLAMLGDGTAHFVRLADGDHAEWQLGTPETLGFRFLGDGRLVTTTTVEDGTARVFGLRIQDPTDGSYGVMRGIGACEVFDVTPDGLCIAAGGHSYQAAVVDLRIPAKYPIGDHTGAVRDLRFGADGRLVTASEDHVVRVIGPGAAPVRELHGHDNHVVHVRFLGDGRVVSADLDGAIRVWARHAAGDLDLGGDGTWSGRAFVRPGHGEIVVVLRGALGVVPADRSGPPRRIELPVTTPILVDFDPAGRHAIASAEDGHAYVIDLMDGAVTDLGAHCPFGLVAALGAERFATLDVDCVRCFDAAGIPSAAPIAFAAAPSAIAAAPARGRFAVGDLGGTVRMFARDGSELAHGAIPDQVGGLRFLDDGTHLAAQRRSGDAFLLAPGVNGSLATAQLDHGGAMVLDMDTAPDGSLATAAVDGFVRVFDRDGRPTARFRAGRGTAAALAFAPHGDRLAVASGRGEVALFAPDGALLLRYASLPQAPKRLAFTPDGATLLASGLVDRITAWPTVPDVLRSQARSRLHRQLTARERDRLAPLLDEPVPPR
ncbi:MAG: protein kinase [Planctomycetes bacterium]|nr:protein kinase [Planctomycetota bacterium]